MDFSAETLQTRESGIIYSKCWKKKKSPIGILYLEKLSFRIEEKLKSFQDKEKLTYLTESVTKSALQKHSTRPASQEMLK
jgi:hypothetical protein